MSSSSSSSASSARGSKSGGWALLDRSPRVADLGEMAREADVLLDVVPPPDISTAFLHRGMLPDDASWDTARCRVEGADASGRLLIGFPSPRSPGESSLLVCSPLPVAVPVPSTSCAAAKLKGRARFLPAVPEDILGHGMSTGHPSGIICDRGAKSGDDFIVAQLHMLPHSSTSAPVVALVLYFSSEDEAWTVKELTGDDRWRAFRPNSVVSHDRGCGDGRLVFVDLRQGLLLFHPRRTDSGFVQFPELGDGVGPEQGDATVDSSEGKVVYVVFYDVPEGTMVALWSLSEDELSWRPHFELGSDEVFACDQSVSPLQGLRSVAAVDPNNMTQILPALRSPEDGMMHSFFVEVRPAEMFPRRVVLLGGVKKCECHECVVCCLPGTSAKTAWMETMHNALKDALKDAKEVGVIALRGIQMAREYTDQLPGAVEMVGGALGLPYTGAVILAAKVIKTANTSFRIIEATSSFLSKHRPGAPPLWDQYSTVGTTEEAERAIELWKEMGMPAGLEVQPAPGTTPEQVVCLRSVFLDAGAESLVNSFDYIFVEPAPHF